MQISHDFARSGTLSLNSVVKRTKKNTNHCCADRAGTAQAPIFGEPKAAAAAVRNGWEPPGTCFLVILGSCFPCAVHDDDDLLTAKSELVSGVSLSYF